MKIDDIGLVLKSKRKHLDSLKVKYELLQTRGKYLEEDINRIKLDIDIYNKASILLNSIGEEKQNQAHSQIESLVTRGLQAIFGSNYSFHVQQVKKNNRVEVNFTIRSPVSGGHIIETPVLGARGGGVAAVVGVLLRVVIILLDKKDKDTPLILDESFSHLSDGHLSAICQFIRELVDATGIQIIMVTHQRDFGVYADKLYELSIRAGLTVIKELSVSDI